MTESDPTVPPAQLRDYGALFRRQWWVLVLATVFGIVAAIAYTASQPEAYTSVTDVLVTSTGVEDDSISTTARTRAEINLDTEAQLLTSTAVVALASEQLNSTLPLTQLADRVSVTVPPNTEVLTIAFRAESPRAANAGANAFATAYLANRTADAGDEITARLEARQSQVLTLTTNLQEATSGLTGVPLGSPERALIEAQIQTISAQIATLTSQSNELDSLAITPGRVITDATEPSTPSSPVLPINLAGGTMLGLLLGVGLALLRQRRDHRLHDTVQVEQEVGLPILVALSGLDTPDVSGPDTPDGRAYSRLRNLIASRQTTPQVVLVTTIAPDGSAVATNLAVALARTGATVALIATHERSRVGQRLGLSARGAGLSEALDRTGSSVSLALRPVPAIPGLSVLLAGRDPEHGADLLQTSAAAELLANLRATKQYVVLDIPPTTTSSQAQTLASLADASVLVLVAGQTYREDARDAAQQFRSVGRALFGAVFLQPTGGSQPRRRRTDGTYVDELAKVRDEVAPEAAEPTVTRSRRQAAR